MRPASDRDVACPRCGYNLRGLTTPRCPECGFRFDFEQLQAGFLRENIPTWLDRCDLWQPHQALLRSLYELARGTLRPRRLLTKLDVNGPLAPAWLMLVFGTLWLWLLTAVIVAVGIVIHTGASPAAVVKAALLVWGPRTLLPSLVVSSVLTVPTTTPSLMRVAHPTVSQRLRLGAYLLPTIASYSCIPLALMLCVVPEFALGGGSGWFMVLPYLVWWSVSRWRTSAPVEPDPLLIRTAATLGAQLLGLALAAWLALSLLPDSLDPPWWTYFP